MNTTQTRKKRGRPPAFDHDEALEQALQLFWQHGYEGTSMAELMQAMGMNKPSIYAAFGNKEELFRKALQRYLAGPVAYAAEALQAPTAYQVVEKFLTASVTLLASRPTPQGCLIVQGALSCGEGSSLIRQELTEHCSGLLPRYMVPERIDICEGLPKTSTGKLDRTALARS